MKTMNCFIHLHDGGGKLNLKPGVVPFDIYVIENSKDKSRTETAPDTSALLSGQCNRRVQTYSVATKLYALPFLAYNYFGIPREVSSWLVVSTNSLSAPAAF
jgi:hypothetical protein